MRYKRMHAPPPPNTYTHKFLYYDNSKYLRIKYLQKPVDRINESDIISFEINCFQNHDHSYEASLWNCCSSNTGQSSSNAKGIIDKL